MICCGKALHNGMLTEPGLTSAVAVQDGIADNGRVAAWQTQEQCGRSHLSGACRHLPGLTQLHESIIVGVAWVLLLLVVLF